MSAKDDLIAELDDLAEHHWINLENSTDRFLAQNYRLVVPVDDLRDVLDKYRARTPFWSQECGYRTSRVTCLVQRWEHASLVEGHEFGAR